MVRSFQRRNQPARTTQRSAPRQNPRRKRMRKKKQKQPKTPVLKTRQPATTQKLRPKTQWKSNNSTVGYTPPYFQKYAPHRTPAWFPQGKFCFAYGRYSWILCARARVKTSSYTIQAWPMAALPRLSDRQSQRLTDVFRAGCAFNKSPAYWFNTRFLHY